MFSIPNFSRYLLSLSIVAVVAVIIYFAGNSIGFNQLSPFAILVIGLFLGHLIAALIPHHAIPVSSSTSAAMDDDIATLYVGNISYNASRRDLEHFISQYGDVHSTRIMTDKHTRKPRGYGFVEVNQSQAQEIIRDLDGAEFKGRTLKVNIANKKEA